MKLKDTGKIPHHRASGAERLAALADFVEDLPTGKLTFARWFGQGRGCAVGLAAAQEPWFLAQGLKLEREESLKDCRPSYCGLSDWEAVAAFFGLAVVEARQLFDRIGYQGRIRPAPQEVAARIRAHLARTEASVQGTPAQGETVTA